MSEEIATYVGSACEVKNMQNDLLLNGRLNALLKEEGGLLEIVSLDGTPLMLHKRGEWVKLHVFNNEKGSLIAKGRVFGTSAQAWQLSEVSPYGNEERRGFFRIKTNCTAQVHRISEHDFPAQIRSISLSGALLVTAAEYALGDELVVTHLTLGDDSIPFTVRCRVARAERADAPRPAAEQPVAAAAEEAALPEPEYHYGCEFMQMKQGEADRMCRAIFRLQHEAVRCRRHGGL